MPYRKEQFINGEVYHTILRALDNNLIFKDQNDYYRGIFSIYEFNNQKPTTIQQRRKARAASKKADRDPISNRIIRDERDKFVEIMAFCFMPNHLHLVLKQLRDNGVTNFMKKIGIGYGGYFNRKYGRKGYVFQNRFRAVPIKDDDQLKTIFVYVHVNPLSLIKPNWKENGVDNFREVINFLENYKWSSYQDYLSINNFPSVTSRDFFASIMGGEEGCRDYVNNWLKYKEKIGKFSKIFLE